MGLVDNKQQQEQLFPSNFKLVSFPCCVDESMPAYAPNEQPPLVARSSSYEGDDVEDEEDPVFLEALLANPAGKAFSLGIVMFSVKR